MKNETPTPTQTVDAVSLSKAIHCIKKYRHEMHDHFHIPKKDIVKAFTIHAEELFEAMCLVDGKPTYPKIRVYLGKAHGERAHHMKLFVVPVDVNDKDVIHQASTPSDIEGLEDGEPYVYDLNAPCPNTCDTTSVLYNA